MIRRAYKKAFTLLEVNLAVFVMATGVLSMCALYSLGFRENRQSVEDVAGVSYAETYLAPLVQGLSATNMPWSSWIKIGDEPSSDTMSSSSSTSSSPPDFADGVWPARGWAEYIENIQDRRQVRFRVRSNPRATADDVWGRTNAQTVSPYKGSKPSIPNDFHYALVVTRRGTIIQLSFRSSRRRDSLFAQPTYVAEIRFQGDSEK